MLWLNRLIIYKLTGQTDDSGTKNIEAMVPLKYISNFRRTHEMLLNNCETTLDLNLPEKCFIAVTNVANQRTAFSITDTKLYVPVVTLSTQDRTKLLEQLKSSFKSEINWNKYQQKGSTERSN